MFLILLVIILALAYYLLYRNLDYWKKRGIPGPRPYPIVGNLGDIITGKRGAEEIYTDIYRKYEGYPFVGVFKSIIPVLLVRDPDLIKCITLKDFPSFQNNDIFADKSIDPIFARNPFALRGNEWKTKRAQLTNCFSSGKIKAMYPVVDKNSQNMVRYINNEMKTSNCFDAREIFVRLMLDNVAACALGIEGKCFDEPYSEIRRMADNFFFTEGWSSLRFILCFNLPPLANFFKVKVITQEVEDTLMSIVRSTLKYRRENNIVAHDFLQSASQLDSSQSIFNDVDITAHVASFFTDGYETSSRTTALLIFELALNKDVQQKLRAEIVEAYEQNGRQFDYESIMKLEYLDACVHENLRKHSVVPLMPKICTEQFTYTPTNPEYKNISVTIEPGTSIVIPSTAIHHDPKYFEEPEKFKPERFINKDVNKYAYLGFGLGPRMCIGRIRLGSRFAIAQMKVGLAYFLKNYEFTVSPKTETPLKYDPWFFLLSVKSGLWIELRKIEDN
ncbi:unnamed protein product [Phaedon cochleariae]|uniref:Cytochrome P450 n=1 Tax=Phaedon cochleariae TaxID=80249 RepID=A0A9N9SN15_PHACE|nr:unnamed protein product [Phaedon cochleariae]